MKKLILTGLLGLSVMLFTACSSEENSVNHAPTVTDTNISVVLAEGSTSNTNLLTNVVDSDGDNLNVTNVVQVNGSELPTGYTFDDTSLNIDASSIDVEDGVNLAYDLNVTVSDGAEYVSYVVNSVIQDSVNDAILVVSNIVADSEVVNGNDLNISLVVIDDDGLDSISYDVYSESDSTYLISLDSGILLYLNDNNYTAIINSSGLSDGNYVLIVNAIGIVSGELPNSEATTTHEFTVYSDSLTTLSSPTLDSKTYYSINTTIGTFSDDDGVRDTTVELYSNSSLTSLVGSNTSGDFSGLSASTTYYAVTTGEALNSTTYIWEEKTSSALSITTDATPPPPPPAISSPTISLANQTVGDNGALASTDLPAPTISNVVAGAVYSIVGDPTSGKLTINAGTGIATWSGDLFADTDFSITIKVVNPDGGTSSTTFTLTVIDNL